MEEYLVKEHDTLWKIARKHKTTVDVLASLNKLKGRQIHQLRVDQKLYLPGDDSSTPDTKLNVYFRGLDFKQITPKRVKVEHDQKQSVRELKSRDPMDLLIRDHALGLKIWIEDFQKKMVLVFERDIVPLGHWNLNVDSRAVKTDGTLQPKKGSQSATTPDIKQNTTHNAQVTKGNTAVEHSRIENGKPVQALATIYTGKNLRLHPKNEKYRQYLIDSAERHGLTPQALAAKIDAEAAPVDGGWYERSNENDPKLAQGLAQFYEAAWLDVSQNKSSLLYADCRTLGKSALLKKRHEAKYAIDAAATYAAMNLKNFAKQSGFAVDQLPPEDKAKLAYLLHHEGLGGTLKLFGIGTQYDDESAKSRLKLQLKSEKKVKDFGAQYDGDYVAAYKGWLYNYTDGKINVNNFVVADQVALGKPPRKCAEVVSALTSKPAPPPPAPKKTTPETPQKPAAQQPATQTQPKPTVQQQASQTQPKASAQQQAPQSAQPATISTQSNEGSSWHDPLAVCTLRSAALANKTAATFGWVRNGGAKSHQGIDLIAVPGTPIYAVADGVAYTAKAPNSKYEYGHTLVLEVALKDLPPAQAEYFRKVNPNHDTIGFFYAHLSEFPPKSPMNVHAGDIIGKTGESGNAEGMDTVAKGAHLHFEVRQKAKLRCKGLENRVDPLPFIQNCTNR